MVQPEGSELDPWVHLVETPKILLTPTKQCGI